MEIKIFQNFLWDRGLKLTKERMAILKEVFSFHGHFDPEQLYLKIKNSGIKASRASVYRTLNLLLKSGLIEKVTRTEKGYLYEHTLGNRHHDHLICGSCGEIFEFYSEKIENLQDEICRQNSFEGQTHTLVIWGQCERCSKK